MTYPEALAFLQSFTNYEVLPAVAYQAANFELARVAALLDRLGNPQQGRLTVHIAGTKGKGSVAAMVAAGLGQAGYRTGLYTSPHLVDFEERCRIRQQAVQAPLLVAQCERVRAAMGEVSLTYFEFTTLAILGVLAASDLDVVILVDASASMRFGSLPVKPGWGGTDAGRTSLQWTKFDCAAAITVALAHLCLEQRDRVGMVVYADGLKAQVRRAGSHGQWRGIVQALATVEVGGVADPARAIDQVLSGLSSRSLLFMLSDFMHPLGSLRDALAKARFRSHDVVLAHILDRQEIQFPLEGLRRFEDMEGAAPLDADAETVRQAYLAELRAFDAELEKLVRSFSYDLLPLDSHASVGPPLAAMLARREAAWRSGRQG